MFENDILITKVVGTETEISGMGEGRRLLSPLTEELKVKI